MDEAVSVPAIHRLASADYGRHVTVTEQRVPAVPTGSTRNTRWAVIIVGSAWTVLLLAGLAHGALIEMMGDSRCEATVGDSNYGAHGWSTLPPGPTCTFTTEVNGFARVDGPTPVMTVWLAVLALGALAYLALVRRHQHG